MMVGRIALVEAGQSMIVEDESANSDIGNIASVSKSKYKCSLQKKINKNSDILKNI